jgi:hypothetical protein
MDSIIIITVIRALHQIDGVTIRPGAEGNTPWLEY